MNIFNQHRVLAGIFVLVGATIMAGCSQQQTPSTEAEKTSFLGDPSKMPADQKAKLQQLQQQGAQRAAQPGVPSVPKTR